MNHEKKTKVKIGVAMVAIAIIFLLIGVLIGYLASKSTTITISSGIYPSAPNYTIFQTSGTTFAKNQNGNNEFSGTDAATVIQSAINALSNGGTIFVQRKADGTAYTMTTSLVLTDHHSIHLVSDGAWLHFTDTSKNGIEAIGTGANYQTDLIIDGFIISGSGVSHAGDGIHFEYAISYNYQSIINIRNVVVFNFSQWQISLEHCFGGNVAITESTLGDTYPYNVESHAVGGGIYAEGCNGLTIRTVEINAFGDAAPYNVGVEIVGGESVNVENVVAEGETPGTRIGFFITVNGAVINGPYNLHGLFTENVYRGVLVDHATYDIYNVIVQGSNLDATYPLGFLRHVNGSMIVNNNFITSGTYYNYDLEENNDGTVTNVLMASNRMLGTSSAYRDNSDHTTFS